MGHAESIFQLFLILSAAKAGEAVAVRLRLPSVAGEILGGLAAWRPAPPRWRSSTRANQFSSLPRSASSC